MKIKISIIGFLMFFAFLSYAKSDTLIPYRIGSKWGFSDYSGNIKIEAKYDKVEFFNPYNFQNKKIAKVFLEDKTGIIDTDGKYLIPIYAESIELMHSYVGYENAFLLKLKGFYGVVNYKNQLIIPFEFDNIRIIENSTEKISNKDKWYFLANKGKEYFRFSPSGVKTEIEYSAQKVEQSRNSESGRSGYGGGMSYLRATRLDYLKIKNQKPQIIAKNSAIIDSIGEEIYGDFVTIYFEGKVGLADQKELLISDSIRNYISPIYDKIVHPLNPEYETPEFFVFELNASTVVYNSGREEFFLDRTKVHDEKSFLKPYEIMPLKNFKVVDVRGYNLKSYKAGKYGFYLLNKHKEIFPIYDSIEKVGLNECLLALWKVNLNGKPGYINEDGFQYFREE
jgi:hypothetical protein